jgi:release factor H-coupled RctB family protein
MPDLHVGQATPIGCVVATEPCVVYPELIGSDIGCGMSFIRTSLRMVYEDDERKLSKWTKQLQDLDDYLSKEIIEEFLQSNLEWPTLVDKIHNDYIENEQLGTIGAGNHFVELQRIEELYDDKSSNLSKEYLYLLVHSGSRSLGERFLREFGKGNDEVSGLEKGTNAYEIYMTRHDEACAWAKRNRALIAQRFLTCLGDTSSPQCLVDIWHNNVVLKQLASDNSQVHLHRKGAAPSDKGRVVIPGSRGTHSYLVEPIDKNQELSGYSLAHGAGRAMSRSKARQYFSEKYPDIDRLKITDSLESHVVCDDKQLLYEEHPQAYKTIDAIIDDLVEANLIRVIAKMRPLITYKTRKTYRE